MASTSLRRQVEALRNASSGTSSGYIQRKKGRPSLLLTPDQAADVDLSSVRETAVMGLQRLEAVDQDFSPFQSTLFSKDAEGTLRDLQTKESNERIDKSITSFLALLSPHFSSREAHFCLEYLIRHYKIYQYNVDAVVECCLPWHDTVAFARMIQLLSLKGSRWEFLTPVQKTGSPLPREAIARRCARDFSLLRFLCVSARRAAAAAAESSSRRRDGGGGAAAVVSAATAAGRAKLFSFYAAVVVEALASLGTASEPLLRALVPTVVHGLSATRSPEYQMASYMILSALSGKGPLSREVTNAALTALVCKPCQGGMEPSLLCALAIAQTQVGFASKKDSSRPGPLLLPTPAFQRLSGVESLASVLARLAKEFDATAFLWLLLQSYVKHLPDEDGAEHCASLTRLCLYPHWPAHSLPRLIRRLVDRLIKTCLTVDEEGAQDEDEGAQEKVLRASRMKIETREVLRVLGQRFPHDVDAAVAKLSKYIARGKAESEAAAAAALGEGEEDADRSAETARREARREEALSSLLVSTFAGADLAARLPLQPEADTMTDVDEPLKSTDSSSGAAGVHASLMVALEHPSGTVRARAVEQLSKAVSEAAGAVRGKDESSGATKGEDDLTAAVLRRLYDEDPAVVLAVTGSDTLLHRVLLRHPSPDGDHTPVVEEAEGGVVDGVGGSVSSRAAAVTSAASIAATPWLSALSQARPPHPVSESGRVLCGLLRVANAAVSAISDTTRSRLPEESRDEEKTREDASRLLLACLPGPHANARVRLLRRACADSRESGGGASEADDATDAAAGRACKKAVRVVARTAVEMVTGLGESLEGACRLAVFDGVGKTLRGGGLPKSSKKGKRSSKKEADGMEVDGVKSKGLKEMGEEVCDALGAGFSAGDKTQQLQALGETSDAGARWLLLECVSRAVPLSAATNKTSSNDDDSTAARLASLLARLTTIELRLRPDAFAETSSSGSETTVAAAPADLLRCLQVCAAHLPRSERPSSLFMEDHVTVASSEGGDAAVPSPLLLGDVLVSVLKATSAGGEGGESHSSAIGAVVFHGYGRRPLSALAAVAIAGVSASQGAGGGDEDDDGERVVSASSALCVAATFVKAEALAAEGGGVEGGGEELRAAERDLVAVFPAAMLAVTSEDKGLREAGLLFISTVAAHGDALCAASKSGKKDKNLTRTSNKADSPASEAEDSELLPLLGSAVGEAAEPSPLCPPGLESVVELATALEERNGESGLGGGELPRHLAALLGGGDAPTDSASSSLSSSSALSLSRYLSAWAARLGWRNPSASARLLECLAWAKAPLMECGLPLLRHCLDSEDLRDSANSARLLKLLLGLTLTSTSSLSGDDTSWAAAEVRSPKSPGKARGKGKDKGTPAKTTTPMSTTPLRVFQSEAAEVLLHRSLRTSGQIRTFALQALGSVVSLGVSFSGVAGGVGEEESTRQRRQLLGTLVEVGLNGGDGGLIASAASALGVMPGDMAVLVGELVPSEADKGRHSKKRKQTTASTGWVFKLGGVVELAQALCNSSSSDRSSERPSRQRKKGHGSSTDGSHGNNGAETAWRGSAPLELARPLFDALPPLLSATQICNSSVSSNPPRGEVGRVASEGDVAAVEYALWLTMDVLGAVLRRQRSCVGVVGAEGLYDGGRAGEDAERVLSCVKENPSPQTRNSGLALLSRMATLFPAAMASRLHSLLGAVCAGATTGEGVVGGGRAALRQTQKAVQSVVPALRAHGAEVGVGAHLVAQVFVDALGDAPVHARRLLFGTLVDSLGDDSLAILSALLLRRAVTVDENKSGRGRGAKKKRASQDGDAEDTSSTLIEFAHQTVHCSGGQAQVRALVGLVQACRRLSVFSAEKSGSLTGSALEDALEQLSPAYNGGGKAQEDEAGYLNLNLSQTGAAKEEADGDTSTASPGSKNAFMTMDLKALAELSEAEVVKSGGDDRAVAIVLGIFLEKVLAFVRDHLVSKPLLMTVAASAERDGEAGGDGVQEGFLLLCEELLLLLRTLAACENGPNASDSGSSWSTLQGLGYSVFETLQSLLSVPSFVAVTQELLRHQDPHLRRKALQMFTRRLDPASGGSAPRLSPGEESLFVEMVPSLRMVAMGKSTRSAEEISKNNPDPDVNLEEVMGPSSNEQEESAVNRQTALLSLDVLARVLGRRHQAAFVGVVEDVTEIVAGMGPAALPGISVAGAEGILPLRASAFLLLATLCAVLGVRAFPHLPRFFPAMLHALEHHSKSSRGGASLVDGVLPQKNGGGKTTTGGGSLLWTSALSAVATVAASLPSFLSPYLGRILAVALRAADGRGDGGSVAPGGSGGTQAADRVLSLLASGVEPRLLVPAVCAAYGGCVEEGVGGGVEMVVVTARKVARLLAYVQEVLSGLEKEAASAALPQLSRLLTEALDFRRVHASGSSPEVRSSADLVETEASSAMVSLVMRLSEVELRPLFLHLCEWKAAIASEDGSREATLGGLDRRLSFYRVLDGLSGSLKSIFTPYFAHVLTDCCDDMEAASLLATTDSPSGASSSSSAKRKREAKDEAKRKRRKKEKAARDCGPDAMSEDEDEEDAADTATTTAEVRWRRDAAARLVLSAMRSCFSSDRSGFVDKARFEMVMPAVVSQLECGATFSAEASSSEGEGGDEVASCRRHAEELVGPCLSQLAAASGKDVLWKALASAVLMRTRSKRAGVRVAALVSLRQCFEVVGEEFLSLLPECLPFLSELLEDGHPEVETECRALVKYIEGVLGESIESYLV